MKKLHIAALLQLSIVKVTEIEGFLPLFPLFFLESFKDLKM